eukprot:194667_1
MQVEIEYIDENQMAPSSYTKLAVKDDNFVSNRRKRNTMRLKLYQTSTQPASLKEVEEHNEYDNNYNNQRQKPSPIPPKSSKIKNKSKKLKTYKNKQETVSLAQSAHGGSISNDQSYLIKNNKPGKHPNHQSVDNYPSSDRK